MDGKPSYEELEQRVSQLERAESDLKKTEEALRNSEARFRLLYERAPLGYQSLDENGNFIEVNQAWLDTLGYEKEEVIGKSFGDFLPSDWLDHFKENFSRFKAGGEVSGVEFEMIKKDGSKILMSFSGKIGKDFEGTFKQTHCILHDISESKREERALQQAKERMEAILDSLQSGVLIIESKTHEIIDANPAAASMFGGEREELVGEVCHRFVCPAEQDACPITDQGQRIDKSERVLLRKDGGQTDILKTVIPVTLDGRDCLLESFIDITERKRIEEELRESEEKYRFIAESIAEDIWQLDLKGRVTYASPAVERIFGYTPEEAMRLNFGKFFPESEMNKAAEVFSRAAAGEDYQLLEFNGIRKDGSTVPIEVSVTPVLRGETVIGVQGIARDITERKRAEEALRQSEEHLQSVFRAAPTGIGVVVDRIFKAVNERTCEMTGYSEEELIGQDARMLYPSDEDYEYVGQEKYKQISGHGTGTVETRFKHKDGRIIYVLLSSTPLELDDLSKGIVFTALDITDRKLDEERLMESEVHLRELFDNMSSGVAVYDSPNNGQSFVFEDLNRAGLESVQKRKDEVVGREVREVFPGVEELGLFDVFKRVWQTGTPEHHPSTIYEDEKLVLWVENYVYKVPSGKLVAIYEDTTAQMKTAEAKRKLETQLQQTQKMESIGRLAGGVSHDLNNLLTPILGFSEMLRDDFGPDDERRQSVEEILRAGVRARDLVRQLLAFSRKQNLEYRPVDMNKAVTGFEKLLRRTIREDVDIEIIPSPDIRTIMADIGQIEQVVMNLAVNAQDAMREGGRITIETAPADLDEAYTSTHRGVQTGAYVMLAVSDNGCGMDDETREHLFEPFFSTKGERGTGLGLATVYGIVKQHGGNIWVYSEPGQGTTFKVYLPVSVDAGVAEEAGEKKTSVLGGSETILLAEDNEQVRRLSYAILNRRGYTVLAAENGNAALKMLESHNGPVHLLLTDVVMPGMSGKELFAKAAESRPGLKVLYMSGYTDNVIAHRGVLKEGIAFLQKPFTVQGLAAKVREVLEQV